MNTTIGCPIPGASQPIQLDENNNFIDPVTGELMHQMTVEEMPTKQELMLGAELYAPNAVRPTAEWIEAPDEGADGSWEACSSCAWESRLAASQYKYFPHCGARCIK